MSDGNGFIDLDAATAELFGAEYLAREKAQKLTAREKARLLSAVQGVFATDDGKRVLWWLLNETHIYRTSFTGNSMTYFLEGERAVGLKALGLINQANPNAMQELVNFKRKEGIEDER